MKVIQVRNVNQALPEGLRHLEVNGVRRGSRNGPVIVAKAPVITVYEQPQEKVLFWAERDANPFFHILEGLWMLGGRNDVEWISYYNSRMREFSDDGKTFHGAYGHRWRNHFEGDQLDEVCSILKSDPNSRRAVITMWDPDVDLGRDGKDLPCNVLACAQINHEGKLDLTVTCRSNDIIFGAHGANSVHFAMLQEYLAARIGVSVGTLYQLSNNYHAYLDVFEKNRSLIDRAADPYSPAKSACPYTLGLVEPRPLVTDPTVFDVEVKLFMQGAYNYPFVNHFLADAVCLAEAYKAWKTEKDYGWALELLDPHTVYREGATKDWDWRLACQEWIERRQAKARLGEVHGTTSA